MPKGEPPRKRRAVSMVARGSRRTSQAATDMCKLEQALDKAVEGLEAIVPHFLKQEWRPRGIHYAGLEPDQQGELMWIFASE